MMKKILTTVINPAKAVEQSPAICKSYIEPLLQSETAIQNRWYQAVEEGIKEIAKNYADDPELVKSQRELFMDKYRTEKETDASFYARKDLISYHFNNCLVNAFYNPELENIDAESQKLDESIFGKSFKEMCYES